MSSWRRVLVLVGCLLAVGCAAESGTPTPPSPLPPLPHGQSERYIAGVVTDVDGRPVHGVVVEGRIRRDGSTRCENPSAWIPAVQTSSNGAYGVRVRVGMSGGTWFGCVFLTFTPPEDSGLIAVSIDSIPAVIYDRLDPRLRRDTLKVNAVLPSASSRP